MSKEDEQWATEKWEYKNNEGDWRGNRPWARWGIFFNDSLIAETKFEEVAVQIVNDHNSMLKAKNKK